MRAAAIAWARVARPMVRCEVSDALPVCHLPGYGSRRLPLPKPSPQSVRLPPALYHPRRRMSLISPGAFAIAHCQCPNPPCAFTAWVHSSR